jgi:RNA polymerase sigma factor (TIGR02999 family)
MRRILVDRARRRLAEKRGGGMVKCELAEFSIAAPGTPQEIVALNDALQGLHDTDSLAAELVKLRFFVGLTIEEAAETMGISVRTSNRTWKFARAWLFEKISQSEDGT